ncbi:dTDP-4-amino-4,6-dideoxygalactose transaminase [Aquella oligotrophica]|uniref:dTDP-4-amino-4,6-dideoxygalactose transaminase n=1 Tax=Aquella oligotrophica TaxID=2067065 RepID=A0A2I7N988_9NEIS|nr:dTDP-4-amino-4,6-dideoxygalactose transaminase [Aquella oligotrophica]AUR53028.1 dTDP-4-amino-4,6-dideoxygalactose transaminase [Aquella oligotrophica]
MHIGFNKPPFTGNEFIYMQDALAKGKISGDGIYTKRCHEWLEKKLGVKKALLTTSCTHALEMAAILLDIKAGDEIIAPSYTFVSTVNAFVLRGTKIKFVDIRPDTMNIDENLIEAAINEKTKAIVIVHYAGVACNMDKIKALAQKYNIPLIEDAAQAILSTYNGRYLGSFGDIATLSFHETKNLSMGEGGALLINNPHLIERAEIIREKGTDRSKFFRGEVDKYTWVDIGSSYLPSELNAAYLWAQLEQADQIINYRLNVWHKYYNKLQKLNEDYFTMPSIPDNCKHNGHIFYIKLTDMNSRQKLIDYLKAKGIVAIFHYVPLHSSTAGKLYSEFVGNDTYTTKESERILRLPLYYGITGNEIDYIIMQITAFFSTNT